MSGKYLLIGDVHTSVKELPDCQKLLDYVLDIVKETKAVPVFLGDLYDSHAIIRAEVQEFWFHNFNKLNEHVYNGKTVALMGNHDTLNNKSATASALLAHVEQAYIAFPDEPHGDYQIAFFSYYHNHDKMVKLANSKPWSNCKYLVCHQSFIGAQYENGFFAPDGIDQNLFPQEKIIAGHIHLASQVGKVTYIGSPRWRTIADAKMEERYLYLVDSDMNCIKKYPTSPVCSMIHRLLDSEESPLSEVDFNPKDRYHIDLHGSRQFILSRKGLYPQAKVSAIETKVQQTSILSQKEPISVSLNKWAEHFQPKNTLSDDFKTKIKNDPFFRTKF